VLVFLVLVPGSDDRAGYHSAVKMRFTPLISGNIFLAYGIFLGILALG
jgi:hypothetical protein